MLNRLLWVCCGFFLLIGMTSLVTGALLTELLHTYQRKYTDGGILLFGQSIGFLAGVLVTPWLIAYIGRKRLIPGSLIMMILTFVLLYSIPPWEVVLVVCMMIGLTSGFIEASIGSLVIDAIRDAQAVSVSRLEVAFGSGSLLLPALASQFMKENVWSYTYLVLMAYIAILFLVWTFSRFDRDIPHLLLSRKSVPLVKHRLTMRQWPVITMCMVVFFLYTGIEVSFANFLPSLLLERHDIGKSFATLCVSLYWGTMVFGRLFAGHLAERAGYERFMWWSALLTFLSLAGFLLQSSVTLSVLFVLVLGLSMSGIFAVALLLATRLISGRTEQITSLMTASAGIGGAALSYLTGVLLDHVNEFWTITALEVTAFLFLITVTIVVFKRWESNGIKKDMGVQQKTEPSL